MRPKEKTKTKKMRKRVFFAVVLASLLGGAVNAQTSFTFKVGGAFPIGDYGDVRADYENGILRWGLMEKDERGGAATGFNLGVEWRHEIASVKGLGIVISLDGFYNGLNEDLRDFFDDAIKEAEDDNDDMTITKPAYLNFPVMAGINYMYEVTSGMKVFGTAAIGANMRFITPLKGESSSSYYSSSAGTTIKSEYTTTIKYKSATTFGFRLAAGILFNDKFSVEFGYYNLGAGKVKAEAEYESINSYYGNDSGSEKQTFKSITPSIFSVRLGIAL